MQNLDRDAPLEGNPFEIIRETIEKSLTLANGMENESDAYAVCVDALVFIQDIVENLITESEKMGSEIKMVIEGLVDMSPEQLLQTISKELLG